MEIIQVNILETFAQLCGGKTTGLSEILFFYFFPAQFFEFSFNPCCQIKWPLGHLDRVLYWFHLCCMHSSCTYDPLNKVMCFVLVNSTQVFQKGFYYRGSCWLYMRNSLADDVVFILMEFRSAQEYSDRKYSTGAFRTLDIKCSNKM